MKLLELPPEILGMVVAGLPAPDRLVTRLVSRAIAALTPVMLPRIKIALQSHYYCIQPDQYLSYEEAQLLWAVTAIMGPCNIPVSEVARELSVTGYARVRAVGLLLEYNIGILNIYRCGRTLHLFRDDKRDHSINRFNEPDVYHWICCVHKSRDQPLVFTLRNFDPMYVYFSGERPPGKYWPMYMGGYFIGVAYTHNADCRAGCQNHIQTRMYNILTRRTRYTDSYTNVNDSSHHVHTYSFSHDHESNVVGRLIEALSGTDWGKNIQQLMEWTQ